MAADTDPPKAAATQATAAAGLHAASLLREGGPDPRLAGQVLTAASAQGYLAIEGLFDADDTDVGALARMREFFDLADDDPRKVAVDSRLRADTRGWMPPGGEPAYQPGTRALVESFDLGHPDTANNAWPDLDGMRHDVTGLWQRLSVAGFAVLETIATAAGLQRDFLRDHCNSQELSTMRLLHYPGQQRAAAADEVGISAHTDFECITLLYQTAPGLELRDPHGNWFEPAGPARQVIVLFGDMLETWTNGRFRATPHRVRVSSHSRYSMVLFFAVNDGVTVAPLPACIAEGLPPRYPARSQRAHSNAMLERAERNRDDLAAAQRS